MNRRQGRRTIIFQRERMKRVYSGGTMRQFVLLAAGLISALCCMGCAPVTATAAVPAATFTKPPQGFARTIVLWPAGAPQSVGKEDGDVPKLYVYPAAGAGKHPCVIVLPGGGYTRLMMEKEGAVEARWLNTRGVTAFVLEYRLGPRYRFPCRCWMGHVRCAMCEATRKN